MPPMRIVESVMPGSAVEPARAVPDATSTARVPSDRACACWAQRVYRRSASPATPRRSRPPAPFGNRIITPTSTAPKTKSAMPMALGSSVSGSTRSAHSTMSVLETVADLERRDDEPLDEQRAEDDPPERPQPGRHRADDEVDGEAQRERLRAHVAEVDDGEERPGDARIERRDRERERLVRRQVDAERDGRHLAVADGAERASGAAAQEQPRGRQQHERDRPAEVVEPVVRRQARPGRRRDEVEGEARRAAGQVGVLLDQRRRGERETEGREREVEAAEPQSRDREQQPGAPATMPASGIVVQYGKPAFAARMAVV